MWTSTGLDRLLKGILEQGSKRQHTQHLIKIIGLKGASETSVYATTSEINGNNPNNGRCKAATISQKEVSM
jgi:hypothetical protein